MNDPQYLEKQLWDLHTTLIKEPWHKKWRSLLGAVCWFAVMGIMLSVSFNVWVALLFFVPAVLLLWGVVYHTIGDYETRGWIEFIWYFLRYRRELLQSPATDKRLRDLLSADKLPSEEEIKAAFIPPPKKN